jgi:hypothetical protein
MADDADGAGDSGVASSVTMPVLAKSGPDQFSFGWPGGARRVGARAMIGRNVCHLICGPVDLSATAAGFSFFMGGCPGSAQPEAVLPPWQSRS